MTFKRDAGIAAAWAFLGVLVGLCGFGAILGGSVVWWWQRGTP
jgi:uncharacterized Tic20 family protein